MATDPDLPIDDDGLAMENPETGTDPGAPGQFDAKYPFDEELVKCEVRVKNDPGHLARGRQRSGPEQNGEQFALRIVAIGGQILTDIAEDIHVLIQYFEVFRQVFVGAGLDGVFFLRQRHGVMDLFFYAPVPVQDQQLQERLAAVAGIAAMKPQAAWHFREDLGGAFDVGGNDRQTGCEAFEDCQSEAFV
jgi:hypothetical protein